MEKATLFLGGQEIKSSGFASGKEVTGGKPTNAVPCSVEFETKNKLSIELEDTVSIKSDGLNINGNIEHIRENKTDKGYKYRIGIK